VFFLQHFCPASDALFINPNPHCLGIQKVFFCKNENKSWMVEGKYYLKIKNVLQKIFTNSLVQRFSLKMSCKNVKSVTHVFIKQIFRAIELAPPFPLPLTGLFRGWRSNGSFQPQAVALVMAMKQ
jgi:hypothetical protein